MQRLHEKNLITQDMIQMATLPTKPPPRQSEADSRAISVATVDANGVSVGDSAAIPTQNGSGSMMGGGYQTPSMMGVFLSAKQSCPAETWLVCAAWQVECLD